MSTDFEKGLRKTIDLSVKSKDFTVDVLKSAMNDFLSGKSQRKGRLSMKKLSDHSGKKISDAIVKIQHPENDKKQYEAIQRYKDYDRMTAFIDLRDRLAIFKKLWYTDNEKRTAGKGCKKCVNSM